MLGSALLAGCIATPKPAPVAAPPATKPTLTPTTLPADFVADVTRQDVAEALMRFEAALYSRPRTAEEWTKVNRRFDAASTAFFAGGLGQVVKQLDELAWELDPSTAPKTPEERALRAVRIMLEPAVVVERNGQPATTKPEHDQQLRASAQDVRLILRRLHPVGEHRPIPLSIGAWPLGNPDQSVSVAWDTGTFVSICYQWPTEFAITPVALYAAGRPVATTAFWSVSESVDDYRKQVDPLKDTIPLHSPAMRNAVASFRARHKLLRDWPSPNRSAVFQINPQALVQELQAEEQKLIRHEDPYRRRTGDFWRVAAGSGQTTALRVYAPKAAADDTPRPLVVVLHGMGGDENMFLDAYGQGLIKKLADQHGFIVASPSTYGIAANAERFLDVLEAMRLCYAIDPQRVYVLGHSMGAMAAGRLAAAGHVKAACLIAGPAPAKVPDTAAPMRLYGGEIDPLIPAARVKASADNLRAQGRTAEYVEKPGSGHTLIVPEVLPDAVEWLLKH
jgi:predicted esterase